MDSLKKESLYFIANDNPEIESGDLKSCAHGGEFDRDKVLIQLANILEAEYIDGGSSEPVFSAAAGIIKRALQG